MTEHANPAPRPRAPEPRRPLPLTLGEASWGVTALMVTVFAAAMLLSGSMNVQMLLLERRVETSPVREPLPDLCTVFAGGAAGLTFEPDETSRDLDRSKAGCRLVVTGNDSGVQRSVQLTAERPEPRLQEIGAAGELEAARRDFSTGYRPMAEQVQYRPLPGVGDQAVTAVQRTDYETDVAVRARDGLLVVTVQYDVSARSDSSGDVLEAVLAPAPAQELAHRLTEELLRRLPHD